MFLLAVPVLIPLVILAPILVPETRDPNPGRLDPISILLSLATMVPIVYAIKDLAVDGFGATIVILLAVGLAFGALFVRRQLRSPEPMLDMSLFRRGTFSGAILVNLLSVVALVGFLFFVGAAPPAHRGLSPVQSGLALLPGLACMIVSGLLIVPIARRISPRVVIPVALGFSAAAYVVVALSVANLATLILAFAALGIGIGAAETVSNELILSSAPRRSRCGKRGCPRRRTSSVRCWAPRSSAAS